MKLTKTNTFIPASTSDTYSPGEIFLKNDLPAYSSSGTNSTISNTNYKHLKTNGTNLITLGIATNTINLHAGADNVIQESSLSPTGATSFVLPDCAIGTRITLTNMYDKLKNVPSGISFTAAGSGIYFTIARTGTSLAVGAAYSDTRPSNNKTWHFVRTLTGWTIYEYFKLDHIPSDRMTIYNPGNTAGRLSFVSDAMTSDVSITLANKSLNLGDLPSVATTNSNNLSGTRTSILGGQNNTVSGTDNVAIGSINANLSAFETALVGTEAITVNGTSARIAVVNSKSNDITVGNNITVTNSADIHLSNVKRYLTLTSCSNVSFQDISPQTSFGTPVAMSNVTNTVLHRTFSRDEAQVSNNTFYHAAPESSSSHGVYFTEMHLKTNMSMPIAANTEISLSNDGNTQGLTNCPYVYNGTGGTEEHEITLMARESSGLSRLLAKRRVVTKGGSVELVETIGTDLNVFMGTIAFNITVGTYAARKYLSIKVTFNTMTFSLLGYVKSTIYNLH